MADTGASRIYIENILPTRLATMALRRTIPLVLAAVFGGMALSSVAHAQGTTGISVKSSGPKAGNGSGNNGKALGRVNSPKSTTTSTTTLTTATWGGTTP